MVLESLEHFRRFRQKYFIPAALMFAAGMSFGCTSQAPSIAHVHIGHAITAHASTPGNEGFFQLAEQQAAAAVAVVSKFDPNSTNDEILQERIDALSYVLKYGSDHSFQESLQESANHLSFAADSADASPNIRANAVRFSTSVEGVLARNDLINLYIRESKDSSSMQDTWQYAAELQKLVNANLNGDDLDGNGFIGDTPSEYGVRQLRRDLDAMIAAENPPYRTVDRWYLFNLIRLPNGDWMFRRNKSGTSQGY